MNKTAAESLGALVRRVREDNQWSLMDVVRNALPDHRITTGYISMIENHQVKKNAFAGQAPRPGPRPAR